MKHHPSIKKASTLYSISIIAFFVGLHTSIPTYFNSSFLSTFIDERTISFVYLVISLLTILGLLAMDEILHRIGNLRAALALTIVQIVVFYGLITSNSTSTILFLFVVGMSIVSLIGLTIDVFLQRNTDFKHTGNARGLVMTTINAAWILGPLIGGMLISDNNYRGVYFAGFLLLFPLLYLIQKNFSNFRDAKYIPISARKSFIKILRDKNISKIFLINIVLQTFYVWMVIYVPIYLHNTLHFEWSEISIMFTIMLIPFVLVDVPLGKLADKKFGEKEMLAIGFTILGISTASLFLFDFKNVIIWTSLLFITRIGAATAEIMIETYFFKKVDGRDPEILSMFRITRPLSYFVAPVIVTIGLVYTTEQYLFIIFGIICLLTLKPILTIEDTR